MAIDYSTLTMGEVSTIETLSGQPFAALQDDDKPKGLALAALAFIVRKREDAAFTWNEAQNLTLADVTAIIGTDEDEPANPVEDASAGKARTKNA